MTLEQLKADITNNIGPNASQNITGNLLQVRLTNILYGLRQIGMDVIHASGDDPTIIDGSVTIVDDTLSIDLSHFDKVNDSSKASTSLLIVQTDISHEMNWVYSSSTTSIDEDRLMKIRPGSIVIFKIIRYPAAGTFITFDELELTEAQRATAVADFFENLGIDAYQPASDATVGQIIVSVADRLYAIASADYAQHTYELNAVGVCCIAKNQFDYSPRARMVSLRYMNCDFPEYGSSARLDIYWGGYDVILPQQTFDDSDEAMRDYSGAGNTASIVSFAVQQPNWKTDRKIINYDEGSTFNRYFPAACVCQRFYTEGTKPGDWYLPALGELRELNLKLSTVNSSLALISRAIVIANDATYWSSTIGPDSQSWFMNIGSASANVTDRDLAYFVRALALL